MFLGHVLVEDGGFVDDEAAVGRSSSSSFKVAQVPHRGNILRIASTMGDRDLVVTPDQFVMVRSSNSPRARAWRKAHAIKPDDWIGTEIPKTLLVIRSSPEHGRTTALCHQRNALFAGVARPVIRDKLGPVLDREDGFLDESHAWFRVTNVVSEPFLSFMMDSKHAVVDNVSLLSFP